jgi:toxin ParE1/3/4
MGGKPARREVLLTRGAAQDLEAIHDYIARHDCATHADRVLDRLMESVAELSRFPERGAHPRELASLGIKDYRQTVLKPYRLVYRVLGDRVVIYLIADGRRDMQSLLARRLLGA